MTQPTFSPNDEARAAFRRMSVEASDQMTDRFFEIWETAGDPREAGSLAAHAYIKNAARMAVFGARCAGIDPSPDLWLSCCKDAFDNALRDVETAFDIVAGDTKSVG